MWEGRQVLGTIFVRWRRKRFDCRLFLFSHRYWFIFPTVPIIEAVSYTLIEFRLGARISASTCFIPWHLYRYSKIGSPFDTVKHFIMKLHNIQAMVENTRLW